MDDVTTLLKATLEEVNRLLSTKSVVGEPIKVGEDTIIPLLSLGFGFGVGGGKGTEKTKGNGEAHGSGAGAGIRPVAVIISNGKGQTRVQPVSGAVGDAIGKLAASFGKSLESPHKDVAE